MTFSYEKLFNSIQLACKDLNIKYSEQREIFLHVMGRVSTTAALSSRIGSDQLGEFVAEALEQKNKVAWLRYLAFYDDNEDRIKKRINDWLKKGPK